MRQPLPSMYPSQPLVIEEWTRQHQRKAHEKVQLLSAAAEEVILKWILKLDS